MNILVRTLTIGMGMGVLFIAAQRGIEWGMLRLMNTPEPSWYFVTTHPRIAIWGAPAMLGSYGLTGWSIGMQGMRTLMVVAALQNVANILASLFFVFISDWKINGAVAGTVLVQWAGFVVSLYAVYKRTIPGKERESTLGKECCIVLQTTFRHVFIMGGEWGKSFRVNKDIFLRTLCLVAVNFFFTSAGGKQGTMMLAMSTLLMTLLTLFPYLMDGFAYAGEALSGKYYGVGDKEGLRIVARRLFGFGVTMVLMLTAAYVFGGVGFFCFLTSDTAVVTAAQPYLSRAYLIPIVEMAAFALDGILIDLTATKGMLFSTAMAMITFFVVYYLFRNSRGSNTLWIASLSFPGMRGLVFILWVRRYLVII